MNVNGPSVDESKGGKIVDSIVIGYLTQEGDDAFNAEWGPGSIQHSRAGFETPGSANPFYVQDMAIHNMGEGHAGTHLCYHTKPFDCQNTLWFRKTYRALESFGFIAKIGVKKSKF